MRLSLKAKLTVLITLLVLLVVVVTSTVYFANLIHQALLQVQSKGEYVATEVYQQARAALHGTRMPEGQDPHDFQVLRGVVQARLSADAELASAMESAVAFYPFVDYVAITDTNLTVLVDSNTDEVGHHFTPAPDYSQLTRAGMLRQ